MGKGASPNCVLWAQRGRGKEDVLTSLHRSVSLSPKPCAKGRSTLGLYSHRITRIGKDLKGHCVQPTTTEPSYPNSNSPLTALHDATMWNMYGKP